MDGAQSNVAITARSCTPTTSAASPRPVSRVPPYHMTATFVGVDGSEGHQDFGSEHPAPDSAIEAPKRACISCKLSKTRCTGGRPCTACLRKEYRPDQCVDGCRACRQEKLLCDGSSPCTNCRDTQQVCLDLTEVECNLSDPFALASLPIRQFTGDRAKLACLACRRDNKKCGDSRPCARCASRKEECVHVEKAQKATKKRCQACRGNHTRCEDIRPCCHCAAAGIKCVDVARKGIGLHSKVKNACARCRRTKIQCEDERPCLNCERRGVVCEQTETLDAPRLPGGHIAAQTHATRTHPVTSIPHYTDGHEFLAHAGEPDGASVPRMSIDATGDIRWQGLEPFNAIPLGLGPPEWMIGDPNFTPAPDPGWSCARRGAVYNPRMHASAVDQAGYSLPFNPPYQQQGLVGDGADVHAYSTGCPFGGHPLQPGGRGPALMPTTPFPAHPSVDLNPYGFLAGSWYDQQQEQQHCCSDYYDSPIDEHAP